MVSSDSEPPNPRKKLVPGEMIFSPGWKSVEFWSYFFPKCRMSDQRGTEFTLTAALGCTYMHIPQF
jgi:hypothetical protein